MIDPNNQTSNEILAAILVELKTLNEAFAPQLQMAKQVQAAKENLTKAKQLFESIPKEFLAENGLELGRADISEPWFSLSQKIKSRFVSCKITETGVRLRLRSYPDQDQLAEMLDVSPNGFVKALETILKN